MDVVYAKGSLRAGGGGDDSLPTLAATKQIAQLLELDAGDLGDPRGAVGDV